MIAVGVLAFIVIAGVLVWPITDLIAAHDVGAGITGVIRAEQLQTARETVRTQLLTLGAGVFAAGALVFTARSFTLTRQGQISDRYSRAVEQIGSDRIDVRIGGIYSLERVSLESPEDHATVIEVLCAFVRERSREPQERPDDDPPRAAADVQAALTVVGRRDAGLDIRPLDLSHAVLRGGDLGSGNFSRAHFHGTDLSRAQCAAADFSRALFFDANLTRAFLGGVTYGETSTRVNLKGAVLNRADLTGANANNADLRDTLLHRTKLTGAYLDAADLTGADLFDVELTDTDLTDARWPEGAIIPAGWRLGPGGLLEPSPAEKPSRRHQDAVPTLTRAARYISGAFRRRR